MSYKRDTKDIERRIKIMLNKYEQTDEDIERADDLFSNGLQIIRESIKILEMNENREKISNKELYNNIIELGQVIDKDNPPKDFDEYYEIIKDW